MPEQNTTNGHGDAQRFAEAIAIANVPTLLMVLVQLTGDLRWLEEPYQQRRARGMDDNDTGGLPEPIQAEIRQAALEAMLAWRAGRPVVECRQDVHDAYNERIDRAHENMVWTHPGMETYYRNARGRVVVNSPYRNATFYEMTRTADLGDFIVEPRQS